MPPDDAQQFRATVVNRRQVLEHIPDDPAVGYRELLRKTGLTGFDLDEALAELENLGVVNSKKTANEVLYWKAGSVPEKEW